MAASPVQVPQPARSVSGRLLGKLQAAWQEISESLENIARIHPTLQASPGEGANLSAIRHWYQETTQALLVDPVRKFLLSQPIRGTLEAMRSCDQEFAPGALKSRAALDRHFQRLLVVASLDLCEPWRIWRGGNHPAEWDSWQQRRRTRNKQATALLERYARWARSAQPAGSKDAIKPVSGSGDAWWRWHRALITTLETELSLRDLELKWFDSAQSLMTDLQKEHQELLSYMGRALVLLKEGMSTDTESAALVLVAPEERLRGWANPIETEANCRLAERAELLTAGFAPHISTATVRVDFLKTFDRYARTPMRTLVEQSWQKSAEALREAEQAKEVLAYWTEISTNRPAEAAALVGEAQHNAITALTEQLQAADQPLELDASLSMAFEIWRRRGFLSLEAELYGWVDLLRRPRGRAFMDIGVEEARWRAQSGLRHGGQWAAARVDRVMESVGGRVPSQPVLPPVVRRTTLRDTLALPATRAKDLPPLYRLLFRLTPIEDRRFLVGRNRELAGLEQAVDDWATGKFAACLLIGARGSGKTSLLNCATRDLFAGQFHVRAEFDERILTPIKLEAFLRRTLQLDEDADLDAAFRAERRILILEEAERIYLRKIGGFAAAHYLTHLIYRTAATTLWIIVMNDKSFRVLDAGTHLHRVFSHRINAMNVSREDLERAVLERHRLSGLRLAFAPPPAGDPRVNRAKRWIGLEDSPQKLFFDSLFQQSEGIFRSAFQLWLSSIERVEGETLRIRQPLDPAFHHFRGELTQEDQFTLLVIQEHGSLTQEELSEVLCETRDHSATRMDRLAVLGLIEPDPEHPGLRVHPEAQRFVNDLLRRTNLT